jgi:hypothetical protein
MKPRGRKRKLAASIILSLRLLFGEPQLASSNSKTFQSGGNSKTEISRTLNQESSMIADFNQEGSAQPEQILKGTQTALKIPSGGSDNTSSPSSGPSKFSPGSKAKGAAKTNFTRQQRRQTSNKPTSSKSSGSIFAEAFTVEPKFPARPGRNGDGLFGRFTPQPTPDHIIQGVQLDLGL